tara:strand:- start:3538 stop:4377 length:840 start_codon:yes stop_codon:yes gene_type:complete
MKNFLIIFLLSFVFLSCSQNSEKIVKEIKGDSIEQQMTEAYEAGVLALEKGDALFAAKKFNEAELLFPQSDWAPRSSLMAAYAYWSEGYYLNSVNELKRFLKLYPKHKSLDYAYYLLAINYYDSIVDEKKDLRPLTESQKYFNILIKEYPTTDYALDAKYKLELIQDILAAKEIYIARHYIKKQKWIAAINRLNVVVNEYDTTIYIEEALHRLVEIYFIIGLEDEAKKYAQTLGYNYQSSEWYNKSYKIFNKDYKPFKKNQNVKKKEKLLDKIKSLINE